ncbi:ABC transporter substrate-binding protein [Oceanibaculum pacificum]|uniref:Nitrate ABC transporter substrate-binding protein n=1 Tax=Oceanibaculum pacificum TaxID=580166 RepID=A0A154W6A0_9PROT|nr:ABC transporter substrate-binding protein [Oceanibaculum pacificum]KZD09017.1 nitrate ABC transporter substrate-binding protein [Oceanibaculum pacificum]
MRRYGRSMLAAGLAILLSGTAFGPAFAKDKINLVLNWTPGADHAPIFLALEEGRYDKAGIELTVESGKGSAMSAQAVGAGASPMGIAEMGTAFVANSKGADLVAVMAIYANSPFVLYWKKSSGINGPKDFAGHTLGNPPADAARVMWPAFAQAVGLADGAVSFVNIAPQAKMPTLVAGRIDIISDFYNGHDLKIRELGDDLGFIRWSEVGINPYGNSIVVNRDYLMKNPQAVRNFVQVTQRAYADCVADHKPCVAALLKRASGLEERAMMDQWGRVKELMADPYTTGTALGGFDKGRMAATYDLIKTYFSIDKPFDPTSAYTNDFLSTDVKMTAQ